jgi:hypothetical protein
VALAAAGTVDSRPGKRNAVLWFLRDVRQNLSGLTSQRAPATIIT